MGSYGSKPNNDASVVVQLRDAEVNENPDPRSPTPEVTRTPLHHKSGSKHNITKNIDLRKKFESAEEDNVIYKNPILSAVVKKHLQTYDPRSPTQDFERTPIVISKTDEFNQKSCASLHLSSDNNNCDRCSEANALSPELIIPKNIHEGFCNMSLNDSIEGDYGSLDTSTFNDTDKNLEEIPTKLLETNFDCVETVEKLEDNQANPTSKSDAYTENIPVIEILDDDPRSPSTGIERTPIVFAKTEDNCDGNVQHMSDDLLIKILRNTNAELQQIKPTGKNTDELLIYEDEASNISDTPKKSKSTSNSGGRTPLTCMKNKDAGHSRSKSANTLYDPKKASKIPKRVSHIPRLKSLSKRTSLMPT